MAHILKLIYGYEAINILFRISPSRYTISILRHFGANIGKGVRIQAPFMIHNADQAVPIYSNLKIGNDCYIGRDCIFDLMGNINIGNKVTISHRALLNTHTDAGNSPVSKTILKPSKGEIVIEDGVYLGTNVTILENIRICNYSIIGAFSLVNKSIPENITAFGVPCKVKENNK
ncbi:MAG: acyltransferase [Candidatus Marinimicrobia bacterium]|nr:acyltransferase [Candidatus Neomarinimicrobiota bacterium]